LSGADLSVRHFRMYQIFKQSILTDFRCSPTDNAGERDSPAVQADPPVHRTGTFDLLLRAPTDPQPPDPWTHTPDGLPSQSVQHLRTRRLHDHN